MSPTTPTTITKLTVGLGYIPSVQFAPFYLAQKAGYYRDAGLDVTFQNGHDDDLINLVGQGAVDIGLADGTSLIPAVSQGIPVRYVTTIYARFPNIVLTKASSSIKTVADLKGKKIGTPGKYGSGWIMLQALLQSADLTTSDVDVRLYPDYGQATALEQGAVDAATGFVNNEPVQLGLAGTPTTVLTVDDIVPLPGNGLITSVDTLSKKHDALTGVRERDAPGDGRDHGRSERGSRRRRSRPCRTSARTRQPSWRSSTPRSVCGRATTRTPTDRGRSTRRPGSRRSRSWPVCPGRRSAARPRPWISWWTRASSRPSIGHRVAHPSPFRT